jgi:hypothetical protein
MEGYGGAWRGMEGQRGGAACLACLHFKFTTPDVGSTVLPHFTALDEGIGINRR